MNTPVHPVVRALKFALVAGVVAASLGATEPLFVAAFDTKPETAWGELPDGWWLEGAAAGARARIAEGRLLLDAMSEKIPGATVWLNREFSGDLEVAFDVHVIDAVRAANNMNFFFLFRDPLGQDLFATRAERTDGRYGRYHSDRLQGTILTFLANGHPDVARVRVRCVPPFEPVLQEYSGHHAKAGTTYRVRLIRRGESFTCWIDDRTVIETKLPPTAPKSGWLGFRTWQTKLWWDNLVVSRPGVD